MSGKIEICQWIFFLFFFYFFSPYLIFQGYVYNRKKNLRERKEKKKKDILSAAVEEIGEHARKSAFYKLWSVTVDWSLNVFSGFCW